MLTLLESRFPLSLFAQGKAGKYTEYSDSTGITKDKGQSTLELKEGQKCQQKGDLGDTDVADSSRQQTSARADDALLFVRHHLHCLSTDIRQFALERQWAQYHKPRNLLLAMVGEVGELAELFQWKQDAEELLPMEELDKIGQELADVSIYLIRMADVCGVTLLGDSEVAVAMTSS